MSYLTVEGLLGDFANAMTDAVRLRTDRDTQRRAVRALSSCTYSLHERLKESAEYQQALGDKDAGGTVRALVFVRGAAEHRGLQAFTRRGTQLMPGSMMGLRWAWLPTAMVRDLLPDPRMTSPTAVAKQRELVALYDKHLADQTLLRTFDEARDLFARFAS